MQLEVGKTYWYSFDPCVAVAVTVMSVKKWLWFTKVTVQPIHPHDGTEPFSVWKIRDDEWIERYET